MLELRPYQTRVIDDLMSWFARHPIGNPIVESSVGSGKSVMIAELCRIALANWDDQRVIMVVRSLELCEQNLGKLLTVWPEAPSGVHSAAMGRRDTDTKILYCTIGSVYSKAHKLGHATLLLVDECHHISNKAEGMYRKFISDLTRYNPGLRVVGWTGTAMRGDGVFLTCAEEPLFHGIASRVTMRELLDSGFLSPLNSVATKSRILADDVDMRAGDYVVSQLAKKADRVDLVESCATEICALGVERKCWLVYCVTVAHAEHVCDALVARGISAAVVSAETPADERAETIAAFRAGNLRAIVNVTVLTVGFDCPEVDFIALLRNTRSPVLLIQIMGRGMRISAGKSDCLVADFTDTLMSMGPVDQLSGRARQPKGLAPYKVCEECGSHCATALRVCPDCGAEFVVSEPVRINHGTSASGAEALSGQSVQRIARYDITDIRYREHHKEGSPDSMRVDYYAGLRCVASEWVCLGHSGFARAKAENWWHRRMPFHPITSNIRSAVSLCFIHSIKPSAIILNETGKYPEVVSLEWNSNEQAIADRNARCVA